MGQGMIEVQRFMATMRQFPPRQRPASFNVDQIIEAAMPRQ